MTENDKPESAQPKRRLDNPSYHSLKDVPPEADFIQQRRNRSEKTARAYQVDINDFKTFYRHSLNIIVTAPHLKTIPAKTLPGPRSNQISVNQTP